LNRSLGSKEDDFNKILENCKNLLPSDAILESENKETESSNNEKDITADIVEKINSSTPDEEIKTVTSDSGHINFNISNPEVTSSSDNIRPVASNGKNAKPDGDKKDEGDADDVSGNANGAEDVQTRNEASVNRDVSSEENIKNAKPDKDKKDEEDADGVSGNSNGAEDVQARNEKSVDKDSKGISRTTIICSLFAVLLLLVVIAVSFFLYFKVKQ
ncbi:MAG: hypothetical protein O7C59_08680, partial [Rickettsia endosymbiont of Ixodes persulcatus]|nr:hypothetical protein [Rickettsia endosymbiont of Ixodes persulcatus]